MIYLDKLDKALAAWERKQGQDGLATQLGEWLDRAKPKLLEDECTVVFTGRDRSGVPTALTEKFDKTLIA